jgi:predicted GTPase
MDIILMGDTKAGRSSIAKVIFKKMVSKQTMLLGETSKMETYDFKIQKI